MTSPSIEDGVATSPRLYSSAFKSNVGRFAKTAHQESVNLQYDIKSFDLSTTVARSPRKFAAVFSAPKDEPIVQVDVPQYDTDSFHMNKTTIRHQQDGNPRQYSFNHTSDRFKPHVSDTADAKDFYDTYTLHKKGIQEAVATSPRNYATMSAKTDRSNFVPAINGDYYPNNHTVQYSIPRSPKRYAVVRSPTERPEPNANISMHDGQYDTDRLHKSSVANDAQRKMNARAFNAPPRLPLMNLTAAPDKVYDPDCSNKATLWSKVLKSGNPYQVLPSPPLLIRSSVCVGECVRARFCVFVDCVCLSLRLCVWCAYACGMCMWVVCVCV